MYKKQITVESLDLDGRRPLWWRLLFIIFVFVVVVFLAAFLLFVFKGIFIPVQQYGIRQIFISPLKGYSDVLPTGRYLEIPWFSKIHIVPKGMQEISYEIPIATESDPFSILVLKAIIQFDENANENRGVVNLLKEVSDKPSDWLLFLRDKLVRQTESTFSSLEGENANLNYQQKLQELLESVREEYLYYGVVLKDIYIVDLPEEVEFVEKISNSKNINTARKKYRQLEEEYQALKSKLEAQIEELRFNATLQNSDIINEAETYKIKKEAEGALLVTEAIAEVKKNEKTILSVLTVDELDELIKLKKKSRKIIKRKKQNNKKNSQLQEEKHSEEGQLKEGEK